MRASMGSLMFVRGHPRGECGWANVGIADGELKTPQPVDKRPVTVARFTKCTESAV